MDIGTFKKALSWFGEGKKVRVKANLTRTFYFPIDNVYKQDDETMIIWTRGIYKVIEKNPNCTPVITVKELKESLKEYSDDMEVKIMTGYYDFCVDNLIGEVGCCVLVSNALL